VAANGLVADRKCFRIGQDLYRMDQSIEVRGRDTGYDATGPYWVVGHIRVLAGRVWFLVDDRLIEPPGRSFVMVLPPCSVVSVVLQGARTVNMAVFSRSQAPYVMPKAPVAFPLITFGPVRSSTDVSRILRHMKEPVNISRCSKPHPLSKELKDRLESTFHEPRSLSGLSEELGTSAAMLSRLFRRDWGKPPVQFRNWLRITESFRHLAEQKAITETAFEAGFNDLSRFHKQFKKTIGFTPRTIQRKSKNAKTA